MVTQQVSHRPDLVVDSHIQRIHQIPIPLVVTNRYEGQPVTKPATQTSRDPNHYIFLARSNQLRTSESYRCQDDVFGYELQFLLSGVLLVFQNLNYKLQRRLSDVLPIQQVIKSDTKSF